MTDQGHHDDQQLIKKIKRLSRWKRLLAVLFRILIVMGLMLLIAVVLILVFTSRFTGWILLLPLAMISIGIFLARIEYQLHEQLYELENEL